MGGSTHGGPRLEDCHGLAVVRDGRCQKPDALVALILVVPAEEPAAEIEYVERDWRSGLRSRACISAS
jgi:hypothetical protein